MAHHMSITRGTQAQALASTTHLQWYELFLAEDVNKIFAEVNGTVVCVGGAGGSGAQGATGAQGYRGYQGDTGTGTQGPQGPQGPQA